MATRQATSTAQIYPKTLIVGVYSPDNKMSTAEYHFEEFLNLIKTSGIQAEHSLFMKVRALDNNMFLTKGKLQEIADFCQEHEIEEVIFSELLSPIQERNLADYLQCEVYDRAHVILTIFKNAAQSSEGKIQVEIAELDYLKTRIIGKGKEFAQQAGYLGNRGPGETAKEVLKRMFEERTRQARKKLETLARSRDVQRKQRLSSSMPLVCIIGYTNAGKSTLLNLLTKSDVLAEDKLFATLDTTTRELFLGEKKKLLISDTVGFISQLPHHLIEAFKSTLDELRYADLLLHVVDASNPAWQNQVGVVEDMLQELGVHKPLLFVFNKQDLLSAEERAQLAIDLIGYTPHVIIDCKSKEHIASLIDYLQDYMQKKTEHQMAS